MVCGYTFGQRQAQQREDDVEKDKVVRFLSFMASRGDSTESNSSFAKQVRADLQNETFSASDRGFKGRCRVRQMRAFAAMLSRSSSENSTVGLRASYFFLKLSLTAEGARR